MDEQVKKYLYDIYEAVSSIFSYLGEKRDFNLYLDNKMLRAGPWKGSLRSSGRR